MKTKSLLIAALMLVSASIASFADENPSSKGFAVVSARSSVFKIIYKGASTGKVKVNVFNTDAELVFTESFESTNGFILPLNLASMKAGEYTIELKDNEGKKVKKITFDKNKKTTQALEVE